MRFPVAKFFPKFKSILRMKYLRENFKLEKRNNDRIYFKIIEDFHKQDGDVGTGDRLSRIGEGTAHKTGQLWGTTFRFYNFLKYFKKSNQTVLDIGCDDAFIRKMIHSGTYYSGTNYIGLELKVKSVQKSSDLMPKCNTPAAFISCDLYEGLPFIKSKTVDIIVCMEIIEHLEEKAGEKLLTEMKRVLKDEGLIFMSQPNHSPDYWYVWRKHRKTGYPWHLCERTEEQFNELCKKSGFRIEDSYGNLAQRKRLLKCLKNGKNTEDMEIHKVYERLVEIMGPEIPTQVIGQMYLEACGGMVHVLRKQ